MKKILCVCFTLLLLGGCVNTVVLHPIEKTDIFRIERGALIGNPSSSQPMQSEKNGWFVSDEYVEQVMKVRVEK